MDISPVGLAYNVVPRLPQILGNVLLSVIGQSKNTEHQDVITESLVVASRPVFGKPTSLLQSQIAFGRDLGIFGRMWVAKHSIHQPEPDFEAGLILGVRQAVSFATKNLDSCNSTFAIPDLITVETEWTGYRANVSHVAPRPQLSERDMYKSMTANLAIDCPTILYLHGGVFCLMDPSTHRWTTSALAKECQGRVFSVRYRLSPQNIFPAALLDAFIAYLALISPPEGSFNQAIPASQIVFAGDSSGAGLAASLALLLLTLARNNITIRFHGHDVIIPSPPCAGLALASPYLDVSRSLPSTSANTRWDFVAAPPLDTATPAFPPDSIWPTSPPRAETYCLAEMVSHPLVSPLATHSELWEGIPPIYVNVGWEGLQDEIEVFARRVYRSSLDAVVIFDGYEGMPHCFSVIPWNRAGRTAAANWGGFCAKAVSGKLARLEVGTWTDKAGRVKEVRLNELGLTQVGCGYRREVLLDDEVVDRKMAEAREWRIGLETEMVRGWKDGGNVVRD